MDTLMEQMSDLVHTQQVAAQEAGYPNVTTEKRYPKIAGPNLIGSDRVARPMHAEMQYIDAKIPYRSYLDLGKALPVAKSSDELRPSCAGSRRTCSRTTSKGLHEVFDEPGLRARGLRRFGRQAVQALSLIHL